MSRRNWILTWTVGLGTTLLSGCVHTLSHGDIGPAENHVSGLNGVGDRPKTPGDVMPPDHPPREKTPHLQEPPPLAADPERAKAAGELPAGSSASQEPATDARATPPVPLPPIAPADRPVVAALRAYLEEKRPDDALQTLLRGYDKPTQDVLLVALPLIAQLADGSLDRVGPDDAAHLTDGLRHLEAMLRPRARLQVERMVFCKDIHGFGRFEPRPQGNEFEAGREEFVRLYVELANVSSKRNGPWHETWLEGQLEIRDFERKLVFLKTFTAQPDRSHSARHDYFINCWFWFPVKLPPGNYTLRLQVKDVTALPLREAKGVSPEPHEVPEYRTATRSLDFKVTLPRKPR